MTEISQQTVEAIKTAIQMEIEGYDFYMKAAQETDNDLGRTMFEQLAKDEMEHQRTFEAMFDQIADPSTWRKLASETPGVPEIPAFREKSKEQKQSGSLAGDANALRIGMENEEKSIKFYKKAAETAEDEQAKTIFSNIAQQEEYHYQLLQAELDSVTGTGFWFGTAEFRMDGKF
jgi:rubrerythrin